MNKPMILYNIKENMILIQKEKIFLSICNELGIKTKKLTNKDVSLKISDILTSSSNGEGDKIEECLIFYNLEDKSLDDFLALYKEKKLSPIALKAIVTPINYHWTLENLLKELHQEHQSYNL